MQIREFGADMDRPEVILILKRDSDNDNFDNLVSKLADIYPVAK